jgi:hypothetical protein
MNDQVFLVNLRCEGTILGGLVRVLPQPIPREKWAKIAADLLGLSKDLTKPLPRIFKSIQGIFVPKVKSSDVVEAIMENAEPGPAAFEKASRVLVELLKDAQSREDGKGKPLSILMDAVVRELGAGEREHMSCCHERTGGVLRACLSLLCMYKQ